MSSESRHADTALVESESLAVSGGSESLVELAAEELLCCTSSRVRNGLGP